MVLDVPVWDYRRETVREQLNGIVHAQVCVVGLGGSGLAALDELRARGVEAVGVDAVAVGAGAAGRNGRAPRPAVVPWPTVFCFEFTDGTAGP
jgi:hypothetical protein